MKSSEQNDQQKEKLIKKVESLQSKIKDELKDLMDKKDHIIKHALLSGSILLVAYLLIPESNKKSKRKKKRKADAQSTSNQNTECSSPKNSIKSACYETIFTTALSILKKIIRAYPTERPTENQNKSTGKEESSTPSE